MEIQVKVVVYSKDLFTSLATQKNSGDKSIRSDVACIRCKFQVGCVDETSWIPANLNLADVLTKPDSPLSDALLMTLYARPLQVDYE